MKISKYPDLNKSVIGYMVNTELSVANQLIIKKLSERLSQKIGGGLWVAPPESLHITLMDWLAPLVDYSEDKDRLFKKIENEYSDALTDCLLGLEGIEIHFERVQVTNSALIFIGEDNGQFTKIREAFLDKITLLPGTKLPPKIIHFTFARFTDEIDEQVVKNAMLGETVKFDEKVLSFRLIRELRVPMLEYQVIKKFPLL